MKGKRFKEEQIIAVLKEAEAGIPLPDLLRKHGVAHGTFYRWESKYGGMEVSDAKRLKGLEDENRRLKRLVADQALDIVMLKDVCSKKMVTPTARRDAARHLVSDHEVSARRACGVLDIRRSSFYYEPKPADDGPLREAIQQMAKERRRWGCPSQSRNESSATRQQRYAL
jgi:putative transposase